MSENKIDLNSKTKKESNFKKRFNWFVNAKLSVWGTKIAAQRHIAALRNAFIANTGFLIVGAFFLIISNFPVTAWDNFLNNNPWLAGLLILPKKLTFDMMSFWITGLLIYNLARTYKLNPIFPMITGIGAFLTLLPLNLSTTDSNGYNFLDEWWNIQGIPFGGYTGTNGILIALLVGILVTEIFRFLRDKNISIKMPSAVPPAVAATFSAMIPIAIVFTLAVVLRGLLGITTYHYLPTIIEQFLGKPISYGFIDTLGGIVLVQFLGSFGWCFGINSSAINGIVRPFWTEMLSQNQNAWNDYIQTGIYHWDHFHIGIEDFYNYATIGGAGATLPIVIFFAIFARSEKLRTIARLALIPGIFNINEPWLFGIPVVLNPFMWLPLILAPVIISIVAYLACYFHLVWMPIGLNNPWTLPVGLLGYFTCLNWTGAVIQIINFFIAGLIWFPFIKFYDLQEFQTEYHIETDSILKVFKVAKKQGVLPPLFQFANPDKEYQLSLKKLNLTKIHLKKIEDDQEKFGYDLKIKKLKGKLRDVKISDFDGKKYPKKEPIITAKINKCQLLIAEEKKQQIVLLQNEIAMETAIHKFYEDKKNINLEFNTVKKNNRKTLLLTKYDKKINNNVKKQMLIKNKKDNNINIINFWLNKLLLHQYPFSENLTLITLQEKNKNLSQIDNNSAKIERNTVKINYYQTKIKQMEIVKIAKLQKKLAVINNKK